MSDVKLDDIVSLCKRRGFIFQGSEIYGGLAGTWDYGPLGVQLKRNISNLWWKTFVEDREDVYGIDAAILMNPKVWEASGHVSGFNDPLVEDLKTKKRYRADHLLEDAGIENVTKMSPEEMNAAIKVKGIKSPDGNDVSDVRQFNMMFKTTIGPVGLDPKISKLEDGVMKIEEHNYTYEVRYENENFEINAVSRDEIAENTVYLRPETAPGMFMNYKNVVDSFSPDMPFALAQIGKAFRNEISPRDFIFRVRELEQMEIEVFCHPDSWREVFDEWLRLQHEFFLSLGLPADKLHQIEVPAEDRAHYSKHSIDTEFDFPFGQKELAGCAYRTDHDLGSHGSASGKNLQYIPKDGGKPFVPHVVEPTFGLDRLVLAVIANAYTEDEVNGEKRIFLKLPAHLAPVRVAVLPLAKNKPELVARAREVYAMLKKEFGNVMWVDTGNIGKNYRKMDEIGVPQCITVDFQTLEDNTVTVRNRDTIEQERTPIDNIVAFVKT